MSRSNGIGLQEINISEIAFNIKGTYKMSMFIGSCIYKITSPTGRIYIGQSRNIEKRISSYSSSNCNEQQKIHASLAKYGWGNHLFEIIETCNYDYINEREKFWISHYNSALTDGLNILHGGKGSCGRIWTRELRDKLRISNLGKKQSIETIKKRRIKAIGRKRTDETKRKMSESAKGKKHSDEVKDRIKLKRSLLPKRILSEDAKEKIKQRMLVNNHFKGKKHTEETKQKMRKTKEITRNLKLNKSKI